MFIKRLIQTGKKFQENACYNKASSLSYYTLLAIVPVLAVAFGIAKGFGIDKNLEAQILETFYQQKEIAEKAIQFARSTLEQAHSSLVAGVGALMLFWSAFGALGALEGSLNTIFGAANDRSIGKRMVDFLPILIFIPFLVVASSSATFFIISKIVDFTVHSGVYEAIKPLIYLIYYSSILLIAWTLFFIIYWHIPNRQIPLRPALYASFLAAAAFQVLQWAYINLQIYLTSYNAIYGSFAAVPLFLLWIQFNWIIVLGFAQFARTFFAHYEKETPKISNGQLFLSLLDVCKEPKSSSRSLAQLLHVNEDQIEKALKIALQEELLIKGQNGLYYRSAKNPEITYEQALVLLDNN
ncbi:MAG: YihY/virulence factor BrkB family protein [Parachlamydiaceae bacterium]